MKQKRTIPSPLVYLGRAVELETDQWCWKFNTRHKYALCCSESGSKLVILPMMKFNPVLPKTKKAKRLYQRFSGYLVDGSARLKVADRVYTQCGRALHVTYHQTIKGETAEWHHQFETPPIVWADKPNQPEQILVTGGHFTVTGRGIEG